MAHEVYRVLCSATLGTEGELPSEFLLFGAGVTRTAKGSFTVDLDKVIAAQKAYGVRLMIDSEHASLDPEVFKARGDARNALGYFDIEARADGSLWAVSVVWTPEGEERLRARKAVYISPAFMADESGSVSEIINAALTSMPATHNAPALVAASKRSAWGCASTPVKYTGGSRPQVSKLNRMMTPDQVQKIMAALEANDAEALAAICKELLAAAASGGEAPAEAEGEALAETAETPAEEEEEPKLAALTARLTKLEAEKAESVKKLSARVAELEAEKAAEEQVERVALVGEIVKLGYETPATAWEGEPEKKNPAKRFQAESVADIRARVALYRAAPRGANHEAPPAESELSKEELTAANKIKDPEARARFVQLRLSRKVNNG